MLRYRMSLLPVIFLSVQKARILFSERMHPLWKKDVPSIIKACILRVKTNVSFRRFTARQYAGS